VSAGWWVLGVCGAAAGAYTVAAQALARAGGAVRRGVAAPRVALTFDDGPHPDYTLRVLEVLARYGVRATFFFVGRHAREHPAVARAVAASGHEVGSHTLRHRHLWTLDPRSTWDEVAGGHQAVEDAAGVRSAYFRPPWGAFNLASLWACRRLGLLPVLWTVRAEGWRWRPDPPRMVDEVVRRSHPGAIVNLHDRGGFPDTPERVLAALPGIVEGLRSRGLEPAALQEVLGPRYGTRPLGVGVERDQPAP
jgi:peptidoglycan/xylan/chitin deacetylase (PgdA/CDA1 family)